MFTGIVTNIGQIAEVERRGDARLKISCDYDLGAVDLGASISCAGVCLTVVEKDPAAGWFAVDVSAETLAKTTLGGWRPGRRVNLERALKVGDELGGHIVAGHVDGVAEVAETRLEGDSTRVTLTAPQTLAPFIAPKGSVSLDGCSLTVNDVTDDKGGARFGVNLIPHTKKWTTFENLAPGDQLNLEIDVLARYVARLRDSIV
ncbi:MAG: riboflavin synthase [Rhodobacteraceae bacterium]|nr:riboflavin synthase [Paracoccaceae bacterium]